MKGLYASTLTAVIGVTVTLGVVTSVRADSGINTTISGFGTMGGTYTGDGYTYIHNPSEFKTTNSQFDLGLDSRIGVQADLSYGTDLSVNPKTGMVAVFMVQCTSGDQWAARDLFLKTATQVFSK